MIIYHDPTNQLEAIRRRVAFVPERYHCIAFVGSACDLTTRCLYSALCCQPIVGGPFPCLCVEHWLEWRSLTRGRRRLSEFKRLRKKGG